MYKAILRLAVPAVITNVTTPLLALCDVAIVGHMGNAVYIAAIAVGGTMFNMLYWLCGFLRMGSSGTTAQAVGASDLEGAHAICRRALAVGLLLGVLMILFSTPLARLVLRFIDASEQVRLLAMNYFHICIFGAPAVLGTFALTGWFIGMQNSRIPMWVSIVINVFNIAASLTLTRGFGMKIEGVAIGTLSAQWVGFVMALVAGAVAYGWPRVARKRLFNVTELKSFFRINTDIFFRTLCLVVVTLWFTRTGARQGTVMLAANTLLMQLFTIFSYMMDGIAYAGEAICGRFKGARDEAALNRSVKALMRFGLGGALLFTVVYLLGGNALLGLLSSDKLVVNSAAEYFGWALSIPLVSFMAFVWDGVMIGLTRTRAMLASMAVGAAVFFLLYVVLFPMLGNHGLWIAFLGYLAIRGVVLYLLYSSR
ncbi:MAG: MATE family efflux transporter [Firmicutes bacterium]|nr:MATE family efflux transporter [Bacillota bacterium]MCM1401849.1 MATE family efflux transporter [Bacteroides sp.]MCM1477838.1 MATE family efflux transporter [Bacteroides sp.]